MRNSIIFPLVVVMFMVSVLWMGPVLTKKPVMWKGTPVPLSLASKIFFTLFFLLIFVAFLHLFLPWLIVPTFVAIIISGNYDAKKYRKTGKN